jgi:hypothetical protein
MITFDRGEDVLSVTVAPGPIPALQRRGAITGTLEPKNVRYFGAGILQRLRPRTKVFASFFKKEVLSVILAHFPTRSVHQNRSGRM